MRWFIGCLFVGCHGRWTSCIPHPHRQRLASERLWAPEGSYAHSVWRGLYTWWGSWARGSTSKHPGCPTTTGIQTREDPKGYFAAKVTIRYACTRRCETVACARGSPPRHSLLGLCGNVCHQQYQDRWGRMPLPDPFGLSNITMCHPALHPGLTRLSLRTLRPISESTVVSEGAFFSFECWGTVPMPPLTPSIFAVKATEASQVMHIISVFLPLTGTSVMPP